MSKMSKTKEKKPVDYMEDALKESTVLAEQIDASITEAQSKGPGLGTFNLSQLPDDAQAQARAALRLVAEANALEGLKEAYNRIPGQGTWSFFPHTRLSLQRLHAVQHAGSTLRAIHPEAARYCEMSALNILSTLQRDLASYTKVVRDQIGQLEGSSANWALAGGDAADSAIIVQNVPTTSTSSPTKTKKIRGTK